MTRLRTSLEYVSGIGLGGCLHLAGFFAGLLDRVLPADLFEALAREAFESTRLRDEGAPKPSRNRALADHARKVGDGARSARDAGVRVAAELVNRVGDDAPAQRLRQVDRRHRGDLLFVEHSAEA